MPKIKALSYSEMIVIVKKYNGYEKVSTNGSHEKWVLKVNGKITDLLIVSTHPNRYTYEDTIKEHNLRLTKKK